MKILVLGLILFFAGHQPAQACARPQNPLAVQSSELRNLFSSDELYAKIRECGGEELISIVVQGSYYQINTNGCRFKATAKYLSPERPAGMCPMFDGFEFSDLEYVTGTIVLD